MTGASAISLRLSIAAAALSGALPVLATCLWLGRGPSLARSGGARLSTPTSKGAS